MAHSSASLPGMPKEIQLEILRNLLLTRRTTRVGSQRVAAHQGLQPAILRTCSNLCADARGILYHENIFLRVINNWNQLESALRDFGVHSILTPLDSLGFQRHSFDIFINFDLPFRNPVYHLIIACEEVRSLCNVLWILTSTTAVPVRSIHIEVLAHNLNLAVPRRTQGAILAPFATQWHVNNMTWARGTHIEVVCGAGPLKPRRIDLLAPKGLLMAMRFFKERIDQILPKGDYMEAAVLGSKSLYVGALLDKTPTVMSAKVALNQPFSDPNSIWHKMAAAFFNTQIRLAFSHSKMKKYALAHKHAFCAIDTYDYIRWVPTVPILREEVGVVRKIRIHTSANEASTCYLCRKVGFKYCSG